MLSKKTKYAISALVYLAKHLNEQPISVSRIAADQNIPLKFLEVILVELRNAQIISSKKGKMGGYTLKETPEKIDLARIIRLFDGSVALLPCVSPQFYERCEDCTDELSCGIRQVALEIRHETLERLKKATLANIIERELKMKHPNF